MVAFNRTSLLFLFALEVYIFLVTAASISSKNSAIGNEALTSNILKLPRRDSNNYNETLYYKNIKNNKRKESSTSIKTGVTYNGDGTYYGTGLGSCGITSTDKQLIVALNHEQMNNGANPNNNPLCGKHLRIKGPKGSVTVKIVDTCAGCKYGDVDMSPSAFAKIEKIAVGRFKASWELLD